MHCALIAMRYNVAMFKSDPSLSLLMSLRKLMMLMRRKILIPLGKQYDLQPVDLRLMMNLIANKQYSKKCLANDVGMNDSAMSRSLDRLVKAGYLQRNTAPHDRREVSIALSEPGKKLQKKLVKQVSQFWQKVCTNHSEKELAMHSHFLQQLTQNIETAFEEPYHETE